MEEEDLFQGLKEVEAAMDTGKVDLETVDSSEKISVKEGSDEEMDEEFLNQYESTFNFIDSELDALRSSIDDIQPSFSGEQGDKKIQDMDDSSYSSSSTHSPFQMPDIDEMAALNMGLESEPESEGEEETEARLMEASQEYYMEQETVRTSEPSVLMESTEENETQVDASAQEPQAQSSVETLEQDTTKQPLESPSLMETKPEEKVSVKLEAPPRAPPRQLDQTKKPSQSYYVLTTLVSIALAFLTGQRFPKQGHHCHSTSLEMAGMNALLKPHEFQTIDLHLNNNFEEEIPVLDSVAFDYNFEEVLFDSDICEREEDFTALFDIDTMEVESSEPQVFTNYTEAIECLAVGDKAAHAAAIHEALEEHEVVHEKEDFDFEAIEFYFEDAWDWEASYQPMGLLEETYFEFGEISAGDWVTPKLLEMMQNMETVYVMYEEPAQLYADQSINLQFGVTEYEGFVISTQMMHFNEPLCMVPLL